MVVAENGVPSAACPICNGHGENDESELWPVGAFTDKGEKMYFFFSIEIILILKS